MSADTMFELVDERGWRRGLGNLMTGQLSGWFKSSKWWRHALIWLAVVNLILFFTTIGLSAKISRLKAGGRTLGILVLCAAVFLVIQNIPGVLLAMLFGAHAGYGLFGGSVSLAGGHGTAIAWGQEAVAAGLENAEVVGIAFATFGLVAGGIIGGPIAEWLIKKHKLAPPSTDEFDDANANFGNTDGDIFNVVPAGSSRPEAMEILDPWGSPIIYIHKTGYTKGGVQVMNAAGDIVEVEAIKKADGTYYNATTFQVISLGPDGKLDDTPGMGDDIYSFKVESSEE